jgi:hypothetical protein
MSSKTKRHLRSDFAKGNRELPKALSFLAGVSYIAVVERITGEKVERTVELKPSLLKKLLSTQAAAQRAVEEIVTSKFTIEELRTEIRGLKEEIATSLAYSQQLEHNNAVLLESLNRTPDDKSSERSPKSHFNRIQESGVRPGLPAISGGLPSLGKRK